MKLFNPFKAIFKAPEPPRYFQGKAPSTDLEQLVEARIAHRKGNTPAAENEAYKRVHRALLAVRHG